MAIFPSIKIISIQDPISEFWVSEIIVSVTPFGAAIAATLDHEVHETIWSSPASYTTQDHAEEVAANHLIDRLKWLLGPYPEAAYVGGL